MSASRAASDAPVAGLDVAAIRAAFPALDQRVNDRPLIYLDSAASALKPQPVIDALAEFYGRDYANIHRAVHTLSQRSTAAFESARERLARFIGASDTREVIFTRGTTEAINLVAQAWGRNALAPGDEIVVTGLEHHSNIVPWQMLCHQTGARLRVAPLDDRGDVTVDSVASVLGERTRLVACAHVSNALGTVLPVKQLTELAHARGALVLLDGAQAAAHAAIDVAEIGCDFYTLSGHKLYGPSGIGLLWGRAELLEKMAPYQGGGDMIRSVTFEATTYNDIPHKFEAGTPHIAGAVGMAAAVEWFEGLGLDAVEAHEADVLAYGTAQLNELGGIRLIGTAPRKVAVLSFVMERVHPHDIGTILDAEGVAVRTGHHCAQPVMERFGIPATTRASLGVHTDRSDIDALVAALKRVKEFFGE